MSTTDTDIQSDIVEWCDEHLPDIYDVGMYDSEEIAEVVWDTFNSVAMESLLQFVEDEDERDAVQDQLQSAATDWFREHHSMMLDAVPRVDPALLTSFTTKPQVDQHSAEWYAQRRNRLTASEFSQILDGRRGALLRSKVDPTVNHDRPTRAPVAIAQSDGTMIATSWGHRFEPLVRRIYEEETSRSYQSTYQPSANTTGFLEPTTVCDTLGRFTHHTVPWLSASPDGLVMTGPLAGRLVEIKSPKSRQPGEFVPMDYYVQMQIQMEVTDLDAVDFVEAQFAQRPVAFGETALNTETVPLTDEEQAALTAAPWKGYLEVRGHFDNPETWSYLYSEPVCDLSDAIVPSSDLPLLERSVWWLTGWFPRTVLRNHTWWAETGWPTAELFWATVLSSREAATTTLTIDLETDTIQHVGCSGGWLGNR